MWTNEEIELLEDCYKKYMNVCDISSIIPRHSKCAITTKASNLGFPDKYVKNNNAKFRAEYQDYNWCYQKVVIEGKMPQDISNETGYSRRVIEKWTREKFNLSNRTFRKLAKLTPLQYSLILAGTLGDGHIDNRDKYPIYIESHAENQKDYIFWKYNILRNLCNSEPKYYKSAIKEFNGKKYNCQASYRMETRTIDELAAIRNMDKCERIMSLDEIGLCTHLLDDGYRSKSNWQLCFGDWNDDEIETYFNVLNERFSLYPYSDKDTRYCNFVAKDSLLIDKMILKNIPNNLDIIKYKITKGGVVA